MPKITNERYLMLKKGMGVLVNEEEFEKLLAQIEHSNPDFRAQARAFFILLYYTGGRPAEILELKRKHMLLDYINYENPQGKIIKKHTLQVMLRALKHGQDRTIDLPINRHTQEFYQYAQQGLGTFVFYHLRKPCNNTVITRNKKTGETKTKTYQSTATQIDYWFQKWFSIPAYFFRHNHFTIMVRRGALASDIKLVKGGGNIDWYLHGIAEDRIRRLKMFAKV